MIEIAQQAKVQDLTNAPQIYQIFGSVHPKYIKFLGPCTLNSTQLGNVYKFDTKAGSKTACFPSISR